jgi:hypothetical protein
VTSIEHYAFALGPGFAVGGALMAVGGALIAVGMWVVGCPTRLLSIHREVGRPR